MPISSLPVELLRRIFFFIQPRHERYQDFGANLGNNLYTCSLVSSTWRSTAFPFLYEHLRLWTDVTHLDRKLRFMAPYHVSRAPPTTHDYASHIRSLYFSFQHTCGEVNMAHTTSLALQLLHLLAPDQLTNLTVYHDERRCTCDLSCVTSCLATIASKLTHLQRCTIRLHSLAGLLPTLDRIFQSLPQSSLRKLNIEDMYQAPRGTVRSSFENARYPDLGRLHNIRTVKFSGVQWPAAFLLQGIEMWGHRLRKVKVLDCMGLVADQMITTLAERCPHLELLTFNKGHVTDGAMVRLLEACAGLKTLKCNAVSGITDEVLRRCGASKVHKWKAIQFTCCPGVKGEGVVDVEAFAGLSMIWVVGENRIGSVDEVFARKVLEVVGKELMYCMLGNLFGMKDGKVIRSNLGTGSV